jgi:hypothetical protein
VTRHGMGKDIWNVPFDDITLMLKVRSVICYAAKSGGTPKKESPIN